MQSAVYMADSSKEGMVSLKTSLPTALDRIDVHLQRANSAMHKLQHKHKDSAAQTMMSWVKGFVA